MHETPPYAHYTLLSVNAPEVLSIADQNRGLLVLDATWRYARDMEKNIRLENTTFILRRLPAHFSTAYPRRQHDCSDPAAGLASIEAIFCAYTILGRSTEGLLDHYHWKDSFLEKNRSHLI